MDHTHKKRIKYLGRNLTKEAKDLYMKTIGHCRKRLKKTQTNGKLFCAHGLVELTVSKSPYYLKKYTHSTQPLSKSKGHFSQK